MNISSLAFISFLASSTSFSSTTNTKQNQVSAFMMSKPPISSSMNVVSFTSTIHREEVDLESMTMGQLQQMYGELEKKNEACTEDSTQTNPECDIQLKDERDVAMMKITYVLQDRTAELALSRVVDMELVKSIVKQPWTYPLEEIKSTIQSMESLNCQCTEEGNQTNLACDVQLKDERDAAIETLTLYMHSVHNLVADANATREEEEKARNRKQQEEEARKRKNLLEKQERSLYAHVEVAFDMSAIQDCVRNPGSKSIEVMKAMLTHLEAQTNACTEDGTQTNAECDIEIKAERDSLMESLVSQIHDAKICLNEIKAFATTNNINQMAIDDVMTTVMNTMKTIPNLSSSSSKKKNNNNNKTTNTGATTTTTKLPASLLAGVSATLTQQRRSSPFTPFTALTDEFLIQI